MLEQSNPEPPPRQLGGTVNGTTSALVKVERRDLVTVACTVLEADPKRASPAKTYGVKDGRPFVTEHGGQPAAGSVTRKEFTGTSGEVLNALGKLLEAMPSSQALVCAPPPAGRASWPFVKKTEVGERTDVIARSDRYFPAPAGAALIGLDFDTKAWPDALLKRIASTENQLTGALARAAPAFASAAILQRASSSVGVRVKSTGHETDRNSGQHRFLIVKDGQDVQRAARALNNRLILAGFGWGFVTETGFVDVRSPIDLNATSSAARLWFEGQVKLDDRDLEFVDGRRAAKLLNPDGGVLDTTTIRDLSESESDAFVAACEAVRKDCAAEAAEKRAAYKARRRAELIASGVDPDTADRTLDHAVERHELIDDLEIKFDDGRLATVSEILEDPLAFHKATCPDPLEPDYGGGHNKAILYGDSQPVRIRSLAHGGIDYTLREVARFLTDLSEDAPANAPDLSNIFDRPEINSTQTSGAVSGLAWIDPTGWAGEPIPPREWVVRDWIPKGEVTLLFGDGGTGKSLLAMQLATAAATGKEWLAQKTTKSRVMMFLCEDDAAELQRRQSDIVKGLGVELSDLADLRIVSRKHDDNLLAVWDRQSNTMKRTKVWNDLCADAKQFGADLLIIDTIADVFGGAENERPQVNAFVKSCLGRLGQEIGGTVIALGHPSRAGRQSGEGSSGSTAWNNAVRSRLYLEHVKGDEASPIRVLTSKKSNYSARGAALKLRWVRGQFDVIAGTVPHFNETSTPAAFASLADAAETAIVSVLAERPKERLVMAKNSQYFAPKVIKNIGGDALVAFSKEEVEAALRRMISDGRLIECEVGQDASSRATHGLAIMWDKLSPAPSSSSSIFG